MFLFKQAFYTHLVELLLPSEMTNVCTVTGCVHDHAKTIEEQQWRGERAAEDQVIKSQPNVADVFKECVLLPVHDRKAQVTWKWKFAC